MDTSRGYEFLTDCPTCLTGFHEVAYPGICECKLHGHKTARRNWKGKSYADVSLDRVNVLSIYALHLTTNDYISIYIYIHIYIFISISHGNRSEKSLMFGMRCTTKCQRVLAAQTLGF